MASPRPSALPYEYRIENSPAENPTFGSLALDRLRVPSSFARSAGPSGCARLRPALRLTPPRQRSADSIGWHPALEVSPGERPR